MMYGVKNTVKCCLDDDEKAVAKVKTEDPNHPWNPICIYHLQTFRGQKSDLEFKMIRGFDEPPQPLKDNAHDWERQYLVGIRGKWKCKKCGFTIVHGGLSVPSPAGYGGCSGKTFDWSQYPIREKD